ncbi:MAG TPA: shikimate kinase [Gaiellaceae bacterium]
MTADPSIPDHQVGRADEDLTLAERHARSRNRKLERHIALVGFMGAGKSSLGVLLAEELARPFFDSDGLVQERTGSSVQELFAAGREAEFRAVEETAILELLDGPPAVIALGGGALMSSETRNALATRCFVIHLHVSWAEVRASLSELSGDRPLLQRPPAEVHELYLARQTTYRDADVRIHVPRNDPTLALTHVLYALRRSNSD